MNLSEPLEKQPNRVQSLDLLRGLAALNVCLSHFSRALPAPFEGVLCRGDVGVRIFFVISGFVIPLGLHRSKYSVHQFPAFMLKRFARLHPPYLVALGITLILSAVSSWVRHVPVAYTIQDFFYYLFYFRYPAENGPFWTLAVELLYYILVGLTVSLWFSNSPWIRRAMFAFGLAVSYYAPDQISYVRFLPFFLLGFVTLAKFEGLVSSLEFYSTVFIISAVAALGVDALPGLGGAIFTVAVIIFWNRSVPAVFNFFGMISYSLYLLHVPTGGKLINLLFPLMTAQYRLVLMPLALALSIGVAIVFYRFVELPAIGLSHKVKWKQPSPAKNTVQKPVFTKV